jgi:hypothetical protein
MERAVLVAGKWPLRSPAVLQVFEYDIADADKRVIRFAGKSMRISRLNGSRRSRLQS